MAMTGSQSKPSQSKDTAVLVGACLSHSKPKSSTRKTQGTNKEASMALSDKEISALYFEALGSQHMLSKGYAREWGDKLTSRGTLAPVLHAAEKVPS